MVCRGHFRSGLCAVGGYGFAFSVPACVEGCKLRFVARGFMGRPLVSELLVPALGISGAADTDRGSPYGGMFIGVHRHLLPACCYLLCGAVLSNNPLEDSIVREDQKIQRIVFMKMMHDFHG
jgi:hypothetical protein